MQKTVEAAAAGAYLRRTVFVIAQDGKVVYRWDNTDPPSLPEVDPVLNAVKQLTAGA